MGMEYPTTPDGRYFVVRGRLWRCSNPILAEPKRREFVRQLMGARRSLTRSAGLSDDERRQARIKVNAAKVALGERGEVWWKDGAPDFNGQTADNSPYKEWFHGLRTTGPSVTA